MGLEGQFARPKTGDQVEIVERKPSTQSFPDILRFFSDTQSAYEAPRAVLLNRATINRDALREVASFGDEESTLEYVMLPTPDGVVFYSGSRMTGNPFYPDEEEREIPRSFPLSLFLSPKRDPEMLHAARVMARHVNEQISTTAWMAHWHPKGSAARVTGDFPSGADFVTAAKVQGPSFVFNEKSIFVYSVNGKSHAEVEQFALDMDSLEYLPNEIRYTNEAFARSTKEDKQKFVEKYGLRCIEIPWEDPRVGEIVSIIRGEKKWDDIKDKIFAPKVTWAL